MLAFIRYHTGSQGRQSGSQRLQRNRRVERLGWTERRPTTTERTHQRQRPAGRARAHSRSRSYTFGYGVEGLVLPAPWRIDISSAAAGGLHTLE